MCASGMHLFETLLKSCVHYIDEFYNSILLVSKMILCKIILLLYCCMLCVTGECFFSFVKQTISKVHAAPSINFIFLWI